MILSWENFEHTVPRKRGGNLIIFHSLTRIRIPFLSFRVRNFLFFFAIRTAGFHSRFSRTKKYVRFFFFFKKKEWKRKLRFFSKHFFACTALRPEHGARSTGFFRCTYELNACRKEGIRRRRVYYTGGNRVRDNRYDRRLIAGPTSSTTVQKFRPKAC